MPDLTPAAELRAASATLKAAALSAQEAIPTPWTPDDPMDPELRWIALMDPAMGPPLAEWLEYMARRYENRLKVAAVVWSDALDRSDADRFADKVDGGTHALAVARSINTPTEEQH